MLDLECQGLSLSADGRVCTVLLADEAGDELTVDVELDGGVVVAIGAETEATRWVESNERVCSHAYDRIVGYDDDMRAVWRRTGTVM